MINSAAAPEKPTVTAVAALAGEAQTAREHEGVPADLGGSGS